MDGHRLEKPKNSTEEIYDIMLTCWHDNPAARPSFEQLHDKMETMYKEGEESVQMEPAVVTDIYLM